MIKGVSLDNLGPFITSGGRDTGAGPPEPLDSSSPPKRSARLSAAEPLQLAHCRRTAGALPARAPYGPQSQSTAPRAPHARFAHGKARWRCERRGELREDDEVPNESRCPPRRRPSRRRGKWRCESQQRLAAVPRALPTTSPTSLAAPRDSQLAGARAPAAHSVPPTATTSSRWLGFECETLGGAGGRRH